MLKTAILIKWNREGRLTFGFTGGISFSVLWAFGLTLLSCQMEGIQPEIPKIINIPGPTGQGAEPNLFTDTEGKVYLSWIQNNDDAFFNLQYAVLQGDHWSEPRTIVSGKDWFVNWADFPSLAVQSDNPRHLAAHWLQMSAEGTYDYDIRITQSLDGGQSWSEPFLLHTDGIKAEHGFVSLVPLGNSQFFASWLDGRHMTSGHTSHSGHGQGSMTLRTAVFDDKGQLSLEAELDNRVCECCQTTAALLPEGPIVAYRDRSDSEIRDISMVRKRDGHWTPPEVVHPDKWLIAGCPVNGPKMKTLDDRAALAWFTMADGLAAVKIAMLDGTLNKWTSPISLAEKNTIGRVDLEFIERDKIWVSFLMENAESTEISVVELSGELQVKKTFSVAETSSSRKSGFPVMTKTNDHVIFAWTHIDSTGQTSIGTAKALY